MSLIDVNETQESEGDKTSEEKQAETRTEKTIVEECLLKLAVEVSNTTSSKLLAGYRRPRFSKIIFPWKWLFLETN